jgi:hypothetical protein
MKKLLMFITITMAQLLFLSGCLAGISGKVVDGVTGKPIEKALVVVQWTKEFGFGLTYHELYKIVETETDNEGTFSISGAGSPFVEPPLMIIYKEGYIPWRNDAIFPSLDNVKGNEWKNNMTYKLEIFTEKYTYGQLYSFLDYGIIGRGGRETPKISELMRKISVHEQAEIEKKMRKDKKP